MRNDLLVFQSNTVTSLACCKTSHLAEQTEVLWLVLGLALLVCVQPTAVCLHSEASRTVRGGPKTFELNALQYSQPVKNSQGSIKADSQPLLEFELRNLYRCTLSFNTYSMAQMIGVSCALVDGEHRKLPPPRPPPPQLHNLSLPTTSHAYTVLHDTHKSGKAARCPCSHLHIKQRGCHQHTKG